MKLLIACISLISAAISFGGNGSTVHKQVETWTIDQSKLNHIKSSLHHGHYIWLNGKELKTEDLRGALSRYYLKANIKDLDRSELIHLRVK